MKEGIYLNLNKNYRFYIDGMWEESKSKEVIKIMSPYKDELVGTVQAISKVGRLEIFPFLMLFSSNLWRRKF